MAETMIPMPGMEVEISVQGMQASRFEAIEAAEAARSTAETERESAESARAGAEQARVNAESARNAAESGRKAAEEAREQNEAARAEAESGRATAESERVEAENLRALAETGRAASEAARAAAESARVSAEQVRADAEAERAAAEAARQETFETNEVSRQETFEAAENDRATAEAAREAAEAARQAAFETNEANREAAFGAAEAARASAETARAEAENARVTAETERVEAENARAHTFSGYQGEIDGLKGDFEDINLTKTVGKNILNFDDIEVGNFSSSGALINSTSYSRTRNIIPVVEGETYTLQSGMVIPVKIKMRYVFAYNSNGGIVDSNQFVETYTVPIGQGVVGIKISIDNKYANESAGTMLSKGTEIVQYEPYREIKYVDCGIKIKNAIDYDIIDDMEKDLKRSHYDFRYMDTVCSEYSCASPYIANPGHQSVNAVYDMYDALMSQYPDYITKTLIGTIDDYGYEVYRYDFTPPVPISSTESDVCKILYCTGTHGEYPNIWVGVRFFRDLCDNWRSDKMLQCIRFGCHITAIPLVNPYGFVHNSRKNENGVDINRNFTIDWIFKTDDINSVEYQGLAPASEKSTQIIEALCAGEKFDFGIDHHIYGSFDGSGMLGYFVNCLKKPENVSFANMYGLWANQKCMAENTLISDFSTSYFKTFTQKASFDGYLYGTFENGILWESMTGWGNDEMEAVVESQKFNVECLAALFYSAMKHYRRY